MLSKMPPPKLAPARSQSSAAFGRTLEAVKSAISIERVACDYGEFSRVGNGRLRGRCLSPGHEDRTPSMTVYPEAQRFKCYGCGAHGDVLELVMLADKCELWEAMMTLVERYGVPLPQRPASWFERQERQRPIRDAIDEVKVDHVRLLLFRIVLMPWLRLLPESVREEAAQSAWQGSLPLARMVYERRRGS
jgi:hypothetical protein